MPTEEDYFSENRTGNTQFEADKADYQSGRAIARLASGISSRIQQGQSRRQTRRASRRSSRSGTALRSGLSFINAKPGQKDPFAPFGPMYNIRNGRNAPMQPFLAVPWLSRNVVNDKSKWPARQSTKFSSLVQAENRVIKPIIGITRPGTQIQSAIAQDAKKKSNTTLIAAAVLTPIVAIGSFFGYRHFFGDKSDGSPNYY